MEYRHASTILAIDPGLAKIGYVFARLWQSEVTKQWCVELVKAGVWTVELTDIDERVLDAIDDTEQRAIAQLNNVIELIDREHVTVVVAEKISHPRDAGTAIKVTAFWILLVYVLQLRALHFERLRPQAVRAALQLPKTKRHMTREQRKKLVHDELRRRYGQAVIARLVGHLRRKDDRSHPLDALAALTAVLTQQLGDGFVVL